MLSLAAGVASTVLGLALIPLVGRSNSIFAVVNKLVNGLGSPLLCIMLLGMFGKRRFHASGVLYGGIAGLAASLVLSLSVKRLALQYYSLANLLVTFAACLLAEICIRSFVGRK